MAGPLHKSRFSAHSCCTHSAPCFSHNATSMLHRSPCVQAAYHKQIIIDEGGDPTDIKRKLQSFEAATRSPADRVSEPTAPIPIQMAGHSFHRPRRNKLGGIIKSPSRHLTSLGSTLQHCGSSQSRVVHCPKLGGAVDPTPLPLMGIGHTPVKRWGWEGIGPRVDCRVLGPFPGSFGWVQGGRMSQDDLELAHKDHKEMLLTQNQVGGGCKEDQDQSQPKAIEH